MTLRDDVRATLDSDGTNALDAFGDMAPDLAGTALGHFADTSTLADADALAPIVTASSPVPFDPLLDGVGAALPVDMPVDETIDATRDEDPDSLDRLDVGDEEPVDGDPGAFDAVDDVDASADIDIDIAIDTDVVVASSGEAGTEDVREVAADDAAFGTGDAAIDRTIEPEDLFEEPAPVVEPFQVADVSFDPIGVDILDVVADDFESIDVAGLDDDPGADDLDVID